MDANTLLQSANAKSKSYNLLGRPAEFSVMWGFTVHYQEARVCVNKLKKQPHYTLSSYFDSWFVTGPIRPLLRPYKSLWLARAFNPCNLIIQLILNHSSTKSCARQLHLCTVSTKKATSHTPFHQGSSSAGSEPEPSFKPVLCLSTPKAPAPNQEKRFVSSTKTLLG